MSHSQYGSRVHSIPELQLVLPKAASRPMPPTEVPERIRNDYVEACVVLDDSSKASAALSRRLLQDILRTAANVTHADLYKEIQEVIDRGNLPTHIAESLDAVRNIGNFAAHPMKSQSTGAIVEVEPGEADWNLEVIEALLDFYFVQPAKLATKRASLNQKLVDAGKKPLAQN